MFLKGNQLFTQQFPGITVSEIPVGNWMVNFDPIQKYFLEKTHDFTLPSKIYGDVESLSDRYLNSFLTWNKNLGVLLCGLKGTGKSLLAKYLCVKSGLPVIMVTQPYGDEDFFSLLSSIKQKCIILFDEFDKVYSKREEQNQLLSVLDGVFPSNFLFLLTTNDQSSITDYMLNRPSRIHYLKEYNGLDDKEIREIALDLLDDKERLKDILTICDLVGDISMDVVVSLVHEINLYPKDNTSKIMEYMNLRPEAERYFVDLYVNGEFFKADIPVRHNPVIDGIDFSMHGRPLMDYCRSLTDSSYEYDPKHLTWWNLEIEESLCKYRMDKKAIVVEADYDNEYWPKGAIKLTAVYRRLRHRSNSISMFF